MRASSDEPRLVFVLGTGRCGSTLVQEVLAKHPQAAFVSNLSDRFGFLAGADRWNSLLYRMLPPALSQKGRLRFAPSEGYRALEREVSVSISTPFRDLTEADVTPWLEKRVRSFFVSRITRQHQAVLVHKFTGWPRARFLHRIFPQARFIHVVRDGRAVANSWLQMPWWHGYQGAEHWQWGELPAEYAAEWEASGRSFPLLAGILWKMLIDAFDQAQSAVPEQDWLEVKYEDVVASPEPAFNRMLQFAGLTENAQFAHALGRFTFSAGRADAFRRDLDRASLAQLDRSLEGHLRLRGYSES